MVQSWQLTDRMHVVLRDNAKNMSKGIMETGLPSVGCVAHTFQLSVKRGLATQRNLEATVALCRKIATHFSHSTLAKEKLRELQHTLQLPEHAIMQDVQTRWNSTYYMTERVLEQKLALVNYATDNDIPELTKAQWTLLENTVAVLCPMENVTRSVSNDESTMADVIPLVLSVQMTLRNLDAGSLTAMKAEILDDIVTRYCDLKSNQLYVVSTMTDPRYRTTLLKPESPATAKQQLLDAARAVSARAQSHADDEDAAASPLRRRQRVQEDDPLQCQDDLLEAHDMAPSTPVEKIAAYLELPPIPCISCPHAWWRQNEGRFPTLASVARRYLGAPCTSVASERLFSSAGQVFTDQRNRLAAERAEMLLFIKHNLPAIDYNY